MMAAIDLHHRLRQIALDINQAKERFPAHSGKPALMQALFALEDERGHILEQLRALPQWPLNPPRGMLQ